MIRNKTFYRLIVILILLLNQWSLANTNKLTSDSLKLKKIVLTSSLFDYFPSLKLNTGTINLGGEIYLKNQNSCYLNVGIIQSYGESVGLFGVQSKSSNGYRITSGFRHYLNKHKIFEPAILLFWPHILQFKSQTNQNAGYYYAFESSYQFTNTKRVESILDYIDVNSNVKHYKDNIYTVERSCTGLNIKFGYQCIKKYGLVIDYSIGLGASYISSNSINRIGNGGWPSSENDYPSKKLFDEGVGFIPNYLYQLRLGWSFYK